MRSLEQVRLICAEAAHEMNRVYCQALGDYSQPRWSNAPSWQRESAIKGVDGVFAGNGPGASHASWLAEKVAAGWKFGPVKDPEKKEHPCMVSFAELPLDQQQKDHLFVAAVATMARALGYQPAASTIATDDAFTVTMRPA